MRKRWDGYMTVEASLLMPMVLCVIVIIIYVGFFLYDRCLFAQDSYILCLRESYRKEEGAPSVNPDRLSSGAQRQFGTKYLAVDSFSGSGSADGRKSIYEGTASVRPEVFGSYFLMPKDIWGQSFSSASRKTDPPWYIRSYRRKTFLLRKSSQFLSGTEPGNEQE